MVADCYLREIIPTLPLVLLPHCPAYDDDDNRSGEYDQRYER